MTVSGRSSSSLSLTGPRRPETRLERAPRRRRRPPGCPRPSALGTPRGSLPQSSRPPTHPGRCSPGPEFRARLPGCDRSAGHGRSGCVARRSSGSVQLSVPLHRTPLIHPPSASSTGDPSRRTTGEGRGIRRSAGRGDHGGPRSTSSVAWRRSSFGAPWRRRGIAVATNGAAAGFTGRDQGGSHHCVSAGQRHEATLSNTRRNRLWQVRLLHAPPDHYPI